MKSKTIIFSLFAGVSAWLLFLGGSFVLKSAAQQSTSAKADASLEGDPHALGERLLSAAHHRNWPEVKRLLALKADPNVVTMPPKLAPQIGRLPLPSTWTCALTMAAIYGETEIVRLLLDAGAAVDGPRSEESEKRSEETPLFAAVIRPNFAIAKLLLERGADPQHRSRFGAKLEEYAWHSNDEDLIRLIEEATKIPADQRQLPRAPYASSARAITPTLVPGTAGAIPMQRVLWVSDHELLAVFAAPRRFVRVDVSTGTTTELTALSTRWARESGFDSEMLTVSPDGKWLLGTASNSEGQLWLATTLDAGEERTWERDTNPDSSYEGHRQPPISWINSTQWLEIHEDRQRFVLTRSVDSKKIGGALFKAKDYYGANPTLCFAIAGGVPILSSGSVGTMTPKDQPRLHCVRIWNLSQKDGAWQGEVKELFMPQTEVPGWLGPKFALSADGKQIVWLNYFSNSGVRAILVSDSAGKGMRVIHQTFSRGNSRITAPEKNSPKAVGWTPKGDAITFWAGENGENGLWMLPVAGPPAATE